MTTSIRADSLTASTLEALHDAQVDITGAVVVEAVSDTFGGKQRLWVNVNGVCVLRVCQADRVTLRSN